MSTVLAIITCAENTPTNVWKLRWGCGSDCPYPGRSQATSRIPSSRNTASSMNLTHHMPNCRPGESGLHEMLGYKQGRDAPPVQADTAAGHSKVFMG